MANPTLEQFSEKNAAATAALTEGGKHSVAALQELTKAYQELAAKNVKKLTVAVEELVAAKSPTEFLELQQKLIKDGIESATHDSRHIAELTTAVFTAAFEPVKKQIEAAQKSVKL
jgi:phasin family protein